MAGSEQCPSDIFAPSRDAAQNHRQLARSLKRHPAGSPGPVSGAAALLVIATIFVKNLTANKIMTAISGALAVASGVLVLLLAMSAMDYLSYCEDACCCKHVSTLEILLYSFFGVFLY